MVASGLSPSPVASVPNSRPNGIEPNMKGRVSRSPCQASSSGDWDFGASLRSSTSVAVPSDAVMR